MFPRRISPFLMLPLAATSVVAAPTPDFNFAEDALESSWSWRAPLKPTATFSARIALGYNSPTDFDYLQIKGDAKTAQFQLFRVYKGKTDALGKPVSANGAGELALQQENKQLRVLWNGAILSEIQNARVGGQFGVLANGIKIETGDVQPTAPVIFRDDFMRADGPDVPENIGEWKVAAGVWKTSGSLRPRADNALNPNPFVFRALAGKADAGQAVQTGKWFWSDYSVTASVKANLESPDKALVAGLEAYDGLRGELDFRAKRAVLKRGNTVLAQSAPFELSPDQWHSVRLLPGPGEAKLLVDGIERVAAKSNLAQGKAALIAKTGGENYVDFDDVRVGPARDAEPLWGEGGLPERFQKDRLMQFWASDAKAWKRDASGIWWHTGDFFGPAQIVVPLPKMSENQSLRIWLNRAPDNQSGTAFEIKRAADGKATANLNGKPVAFDATIGDDSVLKLGWKRAYSGVAVSGALDKTAFAATVPTIEKTSWGTKIGVQPLLNGQPLPPPVLDKKTLQSETLVRDGRAAIGVNITPVTEEIRKELNLPDANGAIVDALEDNSPAKRAGVQVGDVIRTVEGAKITDVESLRATIGARRPGSVVQFEVLRPAPDTSRLDWNEVKATTPQMLDYSFTGAPVDWRPANGRWEISERWTCSPQWSFFAGGNSAHPTLWSRFAANGDYTLEAYLATPMDQARGERSPIDLNLSVEGDGKDLASGYSFLFGAKGRSVNQIRRGDEVAWEKPFQLPAGVGDTHQDWFYVRLERRATPEGLRFKYFVNGREIANYLDSKPLKNGGHLAFWTLNGNLSIARARLWHSGIETGDTPPNLKGGATDLKNQLGIWSARQNGLERSASFQTVADGGERALQITNPQSGGDWTVYATRESFDAAKRPQISFDYRVPQGVKINLFAKIDNIWREIQFTGPRGTNKDHKSNFLGQIEEVQADGQWHSAKFDLLAALKKLNLKTEVQALALAAPDSDYLFAGLGGNHRGASYWLRNWQAPETGKIQTAMLP